MSCCSRRAIFPFLCVEFFSVNSPRRSVRSRHDHSLHTALSVSLTARCCLPKGSLLFLSGVVVDLKKLVSSWISLLSPLGQRSHTSFERGGSGMRVVSLLRVRRTFVCVLLDRCVCIFLGTKGC